MVSCHTCIVSLVVLDINAPLCSQQWGHSLFGALHILGAGMPVAPQVAAESCRACLFAGLISMQGLFHAFALQTIR